MLNKTVQNWKIVSQPIHFPILSVIGQATNMTNRHFLVLVLDRKLLLDQEMKSLSLIFIVLHYLGIVGKSALIFQRRAHQR